MARAIPECLRLCWTDPVTGAARSLLLEGALRLGSNRQQNDIVLPLRTVEPFHAEILGDREGAWELVALGPRRLKVDETMTARARLSAGTEFSIGPVAFRVRPAEPALRRHVSSTGSRRAFAPPPPPPPAPPVAARPRGPLVAGAVLVAATALATWSALRNRETDRAGMSATTVAAPAAPPSRVRPKPKSPALPAPLEAGSLALAAPAADAPENSGAVTVLVRLAGASVPIPGLFVTPGGLVVTNRRLLTSGESILVRSAGAPPVPARLVASDAVHDLALLEAAVSGAVPVAPLDDGDAMRRAAATLGVDASDLRSFIASYR